MAEDEQATETKNEEEPTTASKNTITIEDSGPCKKKVIVEIPQEAIKTATDKQYERLHKEALVPGFRKGRAPRRLLEKRFGKETAETVKLKLLADASEAAIKDSNLNALREPDFDFEKIELPAEGPIKFDFEVEVRPEFDLPQLEDIPITRSKLEVTDEQIGREIEQLRKWSGVWTPRETGAAELDDQIIADAILKQVETEEQEKLDNIEVYVRPNGFVGAVPVEKLDDLLIGAKAGDTRQTTVDVPKTFFREDYRGKKVDIRISIKDIKWLKPAALDENFLKRLDVEDENELREKIRDTLQTRLEEQVRTEMTEQIYTYLLDNTEFDLPLDIVAEQSTSLLQRQYSSLLMRGLSREQLDEQMAQLQAGSEQQAKQQLKTFFIMDKIADKLEIEVSEEEINGHIAQLAIQQGQRPERMREQMLRDGSLAQFRLQVREGKCTAKLLESAKITEKKPEKKTKKAPKKTAKKTPKKTVKKSAAPEKKTTKKRKKTEKSP
ncbi:MAG TPA: trigger factor [Sedimentisphaerales bacterium]|nr:trigger factor [Sedimentisphaerales bacterium]